jgi:ketosteroid isomerase-like protein
MTRVTPPLLLFALLLLAGPASAMPDQFALRGAEGGQAIQGHIWLAPETRAMTLVVGTQPAPIYLKGVLSPKGARLEARLGSSLGAAGRIGGHAGRARRWRVRVYDQGLSIRVELKRGKRSLTLTGSTALGARHAGNEALIRSFYASFVRADAAGMAAVYAPEIRFTDPVFPLLSGSAPADMWAMLCESAPKITFKGIRAGARYGVAHWEARYEVLGRPIHNVIEASFEFRQGKIVRHVDSFSFTAWSRQAYGRALTKVAERLLLGTTRLVARRQLKSFQKKRRE